MNLRPSHEIAGACAGRVFVEQEIEATLTENTKEKS